MISQLSHHPLWRYAPALLAVVPAIYALVTVLTSTVDVPYADQWALLPLLERSYQGTLTLTDLWRQHNEHRLLVPQIVMIGLARLTGWNTHAEMITSLILAGGIAGLLTVQARQTARSAGLRLAWLAPLIALAIFSLNQAETWWSGWNLQIVLAVLAVLSAIVMLAQPLHPGWLAGALCAAVIASYSFGSGLLIWPLGLLLLIRPARRMQLAALLAWAAVGILVIGTYLHEYEYVRATSAGGLAALAANPGPYLRYTLTFLGAAPTRGAVEYLFGQVTGDTRAFCNLGDSSLCTMVDRTATVTGVAGLVIFALVAWRLARALSWQSLRPYLAIGLYVLSAAALTSLGRAVYGNHQALAQRYATIATPFWVALMVLLAIYARRPGEPRWHRMAATTVVALLATGFLLATLQGPDHFAWQQSYLAPARAELRLAENDELLTRLFPDPQVVRAGIPTLQAYRLAVFR